MSIYARTIEKYLSYSATDFVVSNSDELKIIKVFRGDPNADLTLRELKKKNYLDKLFSRIDSSNNRNVLVQTISAKVTKTSYPLIISALVRYPRVKKIFERCFDLHSSLKPFGVVPPPPNICSSKIYKNHSR